MQELISHIQSASKNLPNPDWIGLLKQKSPESMMGNFFMHRKYAQSISHINPLHPRKLCIKRLKLLEICFILGGGGVFKHTLYKLSILKDF